MRTKLLLMITVLTLTSPLVNAVIVDISVETDKETYLLDEPVTVFVTAYNPNTEAVTLYLDNFMKVSYLMDDIFDWREDKVYVPLPLVVTIEPYDFSTWDISHGQREMELYPLDIGIHSVIGEVIGYGYSSPIEFEVVPEPATVLLLGMGIVCMRPNKKVND